MEIEDILKRHEDINFISQSLNREMMVIVFSSKPFVSIQLRSVFILLLIVSFRLSALTRTYSALTRVYSALTRFYSALTAISSV